MEVGDLGGDRLADDDRAGLFESEDEVGGPLRDSTPEVNGPEFGGDAGGVDDVLDPDRDPVQGRKGLSRVRLGGQASGPLGVDPGPGMDAALDLLEAGEAGLDHVGGSGQLGHA